MTTRLPPALKKTAVQVSLDQADEHFLVQVPFVDLVQDQHVVFAVALDLAHHLHAVGQVEKGGRGGAVAVQAGLVADLPSPGDRTGAGHIVGKGAGGNAPRLGDVDLSARFPKPPGDAGRLAGPGFGGKDHDRVGGDGGHDLIPEVVDGQGVLKWHEQL